MSRELTKMFLGLLVAVASLFSPAPGFAGCVECEEVKKGQIPAEFLDRSVKALPSGITVWDNPEAIVALKKRGGKYLWVDTRPGTFLGMGTVKPAVNLVYDMKGAAVASADKAREMTRERLIAEMRKVDSDTGAVTVVFFCQGPKCHRSYNAALRAVTGYGLEPRQVVWYRDGYPNLEAHILANPKLEKRIARYLRGDVVER